jgi:RimJ/RimL family protein N-acetyltransferase
MTVLLTPRLRLEPLDDRHLDGFHALNADPEVMRYITGRAETREESKAAIARVQAAWARFGHSWWAFVEPDSGRVVGAGCVQHLRRSMATGPDPTCPLELGWRLVRDRWHRGLASEGARAMAAFAFDTLAAPELYAVCEPPNTASAAVMTRLGMRPLGIQTWYDEQMATYAIGRDEWRARVDASPAPRD